MADVTLQFRLLDLQGFDLCGQGCQFPLLFIGEFAETIAFFSP